MPRHLRASALENRTNRLALAIAKKPYWVTIADGIGLGYRRNQTAGRWVVRGLKEGTSNYWTDAFADADDYEASNANTVLTFFEAQDRAREIARGSSSAALTTASDGSVKAVSVGDAFKAYADDLKSRGSSDENARKIKKDLTPALAAKHVSLLTAKELREWRNRLANRMVNRRGDKPGTTKLRPATVNRACASFKAALNLAASLDRRITNHIEWENGLADLPGGNVARYAITSDENIAAVVASCYLDPKGRDLGLLAEVCAETGTRVSQAARLLVGDLQMGAKPLLLMPVSRKGKGQKAISHHPTPITLGLAQRLLAAAKGRKAGEPLLRTYDGNAWGKSVHNRRFEEAVVRADLAGITIMHFRHSSIVRQLLKHIPVRVVAVNHDTSVQMIERNYSKYIGSHTDEITRGALVDFAAVPADNVVRIAS